ncbi:MAG TPA: DUF1127 domain-containing protein [Telmatospirillum sp.]|nr:DUF1127 domain-containing protein [Telmatospirillum sp.]
MSFPFLAGMKRASDALLKAWLRVEEGLQKRRQRHQLLSLDNRMLKDIGVSRCDAWREATRWN